MMKESTRCLIEMLHWLDRRQIVKRSRQEIAMNHLSLMQTFGRDGYRKNLIEYRQTVETVQKLHPEAGNLFPDPEQFQNF